ncbi:hypothetical protein E1301_Tti010886 [Triplophysa tibetana]|uniref:Uncharacterized protein n=1 Tax=Triplophysa tibetana TaxID=1572043 RepID=A0A5A9N233_9TELE|nr:hypothetical protein E1301_Tti010886 [Triplophysa tibetana]
MNGLVSPSASLLSDISHAAKSRRSSASNDAKLRRGEDERKEERVTAREARPCGTKDPHQPHRGFSSSSYDDNCRKTRTRDKTLSVSSYLSISLNATLTWRSTEWDPFGRNSGMICVPKERDE